MERMALDLSRSRSAIQPQPEPMQPTERIKRWDAAMNRAFKGILPGNVRRAMLQRAVDHA